MSSISSVASVASRPPVAPAPRVDNDRAKDQAKEAAAKATDVAATAVKAQNLKVAGQGEVVDIQA